MSINCDPAALARAASCYCYGDKKIEDAIITYLLCQIAQGGGGGGGAIIWAPNQTEVPTFRWNSDATVTSLSMPLVVTAGSLTINSNNALTSLSFPSLIQDTDGNGSDLSSNTALVSVDLQSLQQTIWNLLFVGDSSLVTINLDSLVSVGNDLSFSQCSSLVTLSLPSVTTIGNDLVCDQCTALTNVTVPNWVPTNGTNIWFNDDNLTAASVETILRRCVLAGVTTCTIKMQGGTNAGLASLSAQGQTDAATLGAQLTINP